MTEDMCLVLGTFGHYNHDFSFKWDSQGIILLLQPRSIHPNEHIVRNIIFLGKQNIEVSTQTDFHAIRLSIFLMLRHWESKKLSKEILVGTPHRPQIATKWGQLKRLFRQPCRTYVWGYDKMSPSYRMQVATLIRIAFVALWVGRYWPQGAVKLALLAHGNYKLQGTGISIEETNILNSALLMGCWPPSSRERGCLWREGMWPAYLHLK